MAHARHLTGHRLVRPISIGALTTALLLAGLSAASAPSLRAGAGMTNYSDAYGPYYTGKHAPAPRAQTDELVVVTFNLRYGERIDDTILAFRSLEPLNQADVVLLQELDERGVDRLARELGFDYVYFPASVAPDGDNFGNAVLSRWPLSDPRKIILPGLHPLTGQQRIATRASARIGGHDVVVYSAHIEVASASGQMRERQVRALLEDIDPGAALVIAGGDFNSVTSRGVARLAGMFTEYGLAHQSANLGPTFRRFGRRIAATDHIFTRGLTEVASGISDTVEASDHYPVWTRVTVGP